MKNYSLCHPEPARRYACLPNVQQASFGKQAKRRVSNAKKKMFLPTVSGST
ncbi:MAG TPA: hypothetical protein VFF29_03535 [Bacteroidota bacterium]|nr:hypothetical protein [Bacteroidota bacterium]